MENLTQAVNLSMERHNVSWPVGLHNQAGESYIKLTLEIPTSTPTKKPKTIFAYSDVSGSMSDVCRDGRTKQQHINHTWTNLLHFLASHPEFNVSINLDSFESELHPIIPLTKVTTKNVDKLVKLANKMRPMSCTNIEIALRSLVEKCESSKKRNYSLMMTDGEATAGELSTNKLVDILPSDSRFAIIAFGTEHNADLMYKLGRKGINTSNWLINDLEKSALVYAEVLTKWMYQTLDDVIITITNGQLYDYITNTWVSSLSLGALSAEEKRFIHIKTHTPSLVDIQVS